MNIQLQQQITPELNLYAYNDIPVLHLHHRVGTAKIALQGRIYSVGNRRTASKIYCG